MDCVCDYQSKHYNQKTGIIVSKDSISHLFFSCSLFLCFLLYLSLHLFFSCSLSPSLFSCCFFFLLFLALSPSPSLLSCLFLSLSCSLCVCPSLYLFNSLPFALTIDGLSVVLSVSLPLSPDCPSPPPPPSSHLPFHLPRLFLSPSLSKPLVYLSILSSSCIPSQYHSLLSSFMLYLAAANV